MPRIRLHAGPLACLRWKHCGTNRSAPHTVRVKTSACVVAIADLTLMSLPGGRSLSACRSKPKSSSRPFAWRGRDSDLRRECLSDLRFPGLMRVPSPQVIILDARFWTSGGNARKSSQNRRVAMDFTLETAIYEEGLSPLHFQLLQKGNRACPRRSRNPTARPIVFVREHETIGRCACTVPGAVPR